jgi:hypothetical protein
MVLSTVKAGLVNVKHFVKQTRIHVTLNWSQLHCELNTSEALIFSWFNCTLFGSCLLHTRSVEFEISLTQNKPGIIQICVTRV